MTANQQLGIIKRVLYWAPINSKLLAYKTLPSSSWVCSSCLGPKQQERHIRHEQLQDQAVRFIAGIKGRDGVEDAKTRLGLIPLHNRRRDQRLRLLMRILAKEEHCSSLPESYNEIMKQPATTMITRSHTRGIPATFRTSNTQYHNSFLSRTVGGLKGQSEPTILHCQHWANTYCQHHINRAYRTCTDEYRPGWIN